MQEYFERELNSMERELTYLKTAMQRSSSTVEFTSQTIPISVNLEWQNISDPYGSARAEVYYNVVPEDDALIIPTLDWYFQDVNHGADTMRSTREIRMRQQTTSNGEYLIALYFIGTEDGPNSDAAKAKNGETITVTVNLTITCSDDFTIRRYS